MGRAAGDPSDDVLATTERGLYCPAGDFYVDPWRPVPRAIITHAHGDHARWGCLRYLCAAEGEQVLRARLGPDVSIETAPFGEALNIRGVRVSLHPAGHILGSAQVRIEQTGRTWVVSGDYKVAPDVTCTPFEPLRCDVFITESTFGLPIYRWRPDGEIFAEINAWWRDNAADGRTSVIFAYSLGKAQRVLSGVDASIGPIFTHGAVEAMTEQYRRSGIALPPTQYAVGAGTKRDWAGALIVAPPSARTSPWIARFGDAALAFASGWMQIRGARRRRAIDRGFVLSDHADWPGLMEAIRATGARRILVTHGSTGPIVRWLREQGYEAATLSTRFEGEQDETAETDAEGEQAAQAGDADSAVVAPADPMREEPA